MSALFLALVLVPTWTMGAIRFGEQIREFNDFNERELEKRPQHAENQLTVTYEYDILGNRRFRRVTDALARNAGTLEWETEYDLLNRPTHEHDPLNPNPKITQYDPEGNKDQVTDKRGHVTDYEYDKLGRKARVEQTVTGPDGGTQQHVTRLTHDLNGNRVWEKDGRGIVTRYAYDALDRRIKTWRDGLLIDERGFDAEGNLEWEEDAKGLRTEYEYFDADLVRSEIGEEAHVVEYSYYPTGERKTRQDPEGDTTRWEYDARNRKTAEINVTENERTEFGRDGNGNLTEKRGPRYTAGELGGSQYWQYDYTLAGDVETVTDPAGNTTTYSYDGRGNRLSATDGANKTTKWYYDDLSRPTKKVYDDGATHYFLAYDASGNLTAERDPNGQRIEHVYDELDRETERIFHKTDGTLHTREVRTYDLNNNLKTVTETRQGQSWTTEYNYDAFDRRTHKNDRFGETVTWGYDKNGNRTSLSSSAGHGVQYRYDDRNRLHKVITNNGASLYDYYRDGQLEAIDYASGASADYTYDGAGRIETITNEHNGAEVSFYDYGYDANGNRTSQLERNGFGEETTSYEYDAADRLDKVTYPGGKAEDYTFDGAWNRITEAITDDSGSVVSEKDLIYNDRHQLTDIEDSADASNNVSYSYDDNGNQTEKVKGGVTTSFVYDARNNLRKVTTGGSTVGQFLYDWRGIRTEKVGARGTQQYTHDQQSVLFQDDDSDNLQAKFLYGPNQLLSLEEPNLPTEYYLFDALDSPTSLVRKDGSITARYAYDAWGEKRHESGDSFNRFGFTGHEHDEETGLIYAKARYYDPEVARFLSEDPAEMQPDMPPSLHCYMYVYQNPTVYTDPDGRAACLGACVAGAVVLTGTVIDYAFFDRSEQVQDQIRPDSFAGNLGAEAVAFSQSAANTVTAGFFDAAQRDGFEGQVQHAKLLSGVSDFQKAYKQFSSEGGSAGLGTLHAIKGASHATTSILGAFTGIKARPRVSSASKPKQNQTTIQQSSSKPEVNAEVNPGRTRINPRKLPKAKRNNSNGPEINRDPPGTADNEAGFQRFKETRAESINRGKREAEERARNKTQSIRPDPNARTLDRSQTELEEFRNLERAERFRKRKPREAGKKVLLRKELGNSLGYSTHFQVGTNMRIVSAIKGSIVWVRALRLANEEKCHDALRELDKYERISGVRHEQIVLLRALLEFGVGNDAACISLVNEAIMKIDESKLSQDEKNYLKVYALDLAALAEGRDGVWGSEKEKYPFRIANISKSLLDKFPLSVR